MTHCRETNSIYFLPAFAALLILMLWGNRPLQGQDGTLDASFGGDGTIVLDVEGAHKPDYLEDILVQPDHKIVAVGSAYDPINIPGHDFVIARFNADGTPDSSFWIDGVVQVAFNYGGDDNDRAFAVDRYSNGKLLVVGSVEVGVGATSVGIIKINTDGSLDHTFGTQGRMLVSVGGTGASDRGVAVKILPNNQAIVGIASETAGDLDFAFVRINSFGGTDSTFGDSGKKIVSFNYGGQNWDELTDIAIQPDGKILAVGLVQYANDFDFGVVRLTAQGQLDTTFDLDGKWTYGFDNGTEMDDYGAAISVQSDGKIVVAGTISAASAGDSDYGVVRLMANGLLDPTFSGNGLLELSPGARVDVCYDAEVLADGRIYVAGYKDYGGGDLDFAVFKLHPDGSPDTTFSSDGFNTVAFDLGQNNTDHFRAFDFDSDGDILLGGHAMMPAVDDTDFAIARLINSIDTSTIFSDGFESGDLAAWSSSSP